MILIITPYCLSIQNMPGEGVGDIGNHVLRLLENELVGISELLDAGREILSYKEN